MSERYQMRDYTPEIVKLYNSTHWKIEKLINNSNFKDNFDYNLHIDLDVMLYVIADFLAFNFKSRELIGKNLLPYLEIGDSWNSRIVKSRIEFYGKIIRKSIKLRGNCLPLDLPTNLANNPLTRCAIAFCDILKTPELFSDYVFASFVIGGFDKDMNFATQVVMPIIDIIVDYISKVTELCKTTQPHSWRCDMCGEMISSDPCMYCNGEDEPVKTINTNDDDDDSSKLIKIVLGIFATIAITIIYFLLNR